MPALRKRVGFYKLATKTGISLNIGTKQSLFVVPTGESAVITAVVLRNVSGDASLGDAGFGADTPATDFRAAVQFDNLAAAGDAILIAPDDGGASSPVPGKIKTYAAGDDFGIDVGTTLLPSVDIDVLGYLL